MKKEVSLIFERKRFTGKSLTRERRQDSPRDDINNSHMTVSHVCKKPGVGFVARKWWSGKRQ